MDVMIPVWLDDAAGALAKSALGNLRGATVAIVDDGFDAPFTARLQALLREQHGAEVRCHVKPIGSAPAPRAMIEAAARAQVAIAGVAL